MSGTEVDCGGGAKEEVAGGLREWVRARADKGNDMMTASPKYLLASVHNLEHCVKEFAMGA